jgi:carboxyl-terminal processing protease
MLAGAPGTPVALVVAKPAGPDRRVVLRRAPVDRGAVDCRIVEGRVLYLRPWGLSTAIARRVRDHGRAAGAAARLVILDLRDNAGGPVDGGSELADSFLASGTVFSVAGARIPNVDRTYAATPGTSPLESARLAVLVNGNTSGSAEAIAAAVQDHRRGMVLGTRTAGVTYFNIWHRIAGTEWSVPVARLVRASGQPLHGKGVTPDVADDASDATPAGAMSDVACPNIASTAAVSDDPLVGRGVRLLLASPNS